MEFGYLSQTKQLIPLFFLLFVIYKKKLKVKKPLFTLVVALLVTFTDQMTNLFARMVFKDCVLVIILKLIPLLE
jgi:RsiW-degrading membrane proteinase PrsW (M82 family)